MISVTWYLVMLDLQSYLFLRQNFLLFIGKIISPFHPGYLLPMRKEYAKVFQNKALPSRSSCPSKNPPMQLDMWHLCLAFFPYTLSFSFAEQWYDIQPTWASLRELTNKSSWSFLQSVECLPSFYFLNLPGDHRSTHQFLPCLIISLNYLSSFLLLPL